MRKETDVTKLVRTQNLNDLENFYLANIDYLPNCHVLDTGIDSSQQDSAKQNLRNSENFYLANIGYLPNWHTVYIWFGRSPANFC